MPAYEAGEEKSIAVLPFRNDSPDPENEYFCNGIMEELLTQLQKIDELNVKSRTSAEQYRNPNKDIKAIGNELEVAYIVEGSVRKAAEIRITAQLIETAHGDHLWAETYDGKYTDKLLDFQSKVAKEIASSLNAEITPEEERRIDYKSTSNITAYDLLLRGNENVNKYYNTFDQVRQKEDYIVL